MYHNLILLFRITFLFVFLQACNKQRVLTAENAYIPAQQNLQEKNFERSLLVKYIKGVNWADTRDNFVDDELILSGLKTENTYDEVRRYTNKLVTQFESIGTNTIRIPINPRTVLGNGWVRYKGVIDEILQMKLNVIFCCWESNSLRDGKVDDTQQFFNMWQQVINEYGSNNKTYFEVFNEPYGYTEVELKQLYSRFLNAFPNLERKRIILDGLGYAQNVVWVGAISEFQNCLLGLHNYTWFSAGLLTPEQWENDMAMKIGNYADRTVVTEFGCSLTQGKNYLADVNGDIERAYLKGITNTIRNRQLGSVYWIGLKFNDTYSLFNIVNNEAVLTNISALACIQYGWNAQPNLNNITCRILSKASGKAIGVVGGSSTMANGAVIEQWDWLNLPNQQWKFEAVEPMLYKITAMHSGKAIDVNGGANGLTNGLFLNQWDYWGGNNQKFAVVRLGYNYFAIVAKHSAKVFAVENNSSQNGARINQWQFEGYANQSWYFF